MKSKLPSRIERLNYILGGLVTAAGALLLARPEALGLLVGAAISALNFSALRWIGERMGRAAPDKRAPLAMLLVPHMLLTMAAITLALVFLPLSGITLLIGFSVFLVSIAIEMVRTDTGPEEDGASS